MLEIIVATGLVAIGLTFAFSAFVNVNQSSKITSIKKNIVFIVTAARKLKNSNGNGLQYRFNGQTMTLAQLDSLNYLPSNFPAPVNGNIVKEGITYSIATGTTAFSGAAATQTEIYLNVQVSGLEQTCGLLLKSLNDYKVPAAQVQLQLSPGINVNSISCNSNNSVFNIWFD